MNKINRVIAPRGCQVDITKGKIHYTDGFEPRFEDQGQTLIMKPLQPAPSKSPLWDLIIGVLVGFGIVFVIFSFSQVVCASEWKLLEPDSVQLELERYEVLRDPYTPEDNDDWVYGTAMTTRFTLVGKPEQKWRLFTDPQLRFRVTDSQVRYGALYVESGFEILRERGFRIFQRHHSEHVMERERGTREYPLQDSWVVQLEWRIK